MAYQTRKRNPLLESHTQEALRKRGSELIGVLLIGFAILAASILWSYSPADPSWMNATSAPVQNIMGSLGAAIANVLILTIGWAAWSIPAFALVWGFRFLLHKNEGRVMARMVFAPIAIATGAIFMATHVPPTDWSHGFGLGGLSGDMALEFLLGFYPSGLDLALFVVTLCLAALCLALYLYAFGFTFPELKKLLSGLWVAVILAFSSVLAFLAFFGRKTSGIPQAMRHRNQERQKRVAVEKVRESRRQAEVVREEPEVVTPRAQPVFRAALPKLLLRTEPEPEPTPQPVAEPADMEQDRVKSRITAAIRNKILQKKNNEPQPQTITEAAASENADETSPRLGGVRREATPPTVQADGGRQELDLEEPDHHPLPSAPDDKPAVLHLERKPAAQSSKAKAEAQPKLSLEAEPLEYESPALSLLSNPVSITRHHMSDEALEENARLLENVLDDYGVKGEIVSVRPGPVVTMYELEPAPGLKASRVIGLSDDIARSMSALSARVSTVPGRTVIGIELPNANKETVLLREILSSKSFGDGTHNLPLALGKDIGGAPVVENLAKMPHLLIAGTTGSGKSVAINTMIVSLLYKLSPEECRMIMIDPKMLELSVYDGIPHLLSPVVTDPKKAVVALKWVVSEMEERYRKMSKMGVRNIEGYNGRVEDALQKGEDFSRTVQTGFDDETGDPVFETETFKPEKMPFIVVVVDEMADLMMVAGKEIEACIQRLAQMARASGIHLIMATQRPSVDVITGTIKANFPTRISFQVTSKIDSRTILGEMGAEQLLGMGDMLFMAGGGRVTRVHGPFVSDEEVEEIVNHLKAFGSPEYISGVVDGPDDEKSSDIDLVLGLGGNTTGDDALYDQAVAIVIQDRKCSTSYIQRKLAIGYNKAARLVEQMEDAQIVSAANHVGKRDILLPEQ